MANYREMYYKLFNKNTDVISDLQTIQQFTEEMYIESEETEIIILRKNKDNDEI